MRRITVAFVAGFLCALVVAATPRNVVRSDYSRPSLPAYRDTVQYVERDSVRREPVVVVLAGAVDYRGVVHALRCMSDGSVVAVDVGVARRLRP